MSILELFSRSKRSQQATATTEVVKEVEVINIDASDSELECESSPRVDDTNGLDDGGGLVCGYSCDQESDDCDGSSCEELSERESFCDEDLLR